MAKKKKKKVIGELVTKTLSRPAIIESGMDQLDREYREARRHHHTLLSFEDEHQALLDATAEACAPGIVRVGRILAKLARIKRWAKKARPGTWHPDPRPELVAKLKEILKPLREARNADPRWKEALRWMDRPKEVGATEKAKARRKNGETDEKFAERCEKRVSLRSRRSDLQMELYQNRKIHWSTHNYLVDCVAQARASVIKARTEGLSASWSHPKWDDSNSIYGDSSSTYRIVERGKLWWVIELRLFEGWVRFRAKCGNWHEIPPSSKILSVQLIRRKNGRGWEHSVSIVFSGMPSNQQSYATTGVVGLDWGHREFGHEGAEQGIRAFTWLGSDGYSGEVLIPRICRDLLDQKDALKSRVDLIYNARKQPEKNRHTYRKRLMRSGVRTADETLWLRWESRYDRRIAAAETRIQEIREQCYRDAIRMLRRNYKHFVVEKEKSEDIKKKQKETEMERRKRQNRDLSARYKFVEMFEWYGGTQITVSARNTTRECPSCGYLSENGPELLIACSGCGKVRDKDYGAAEVILRRGLDALAKGIENVEDE